jgi:hypothetical protein
MMPAMVADEVKAAIDLATERMGSENELYPFSPVFIENHENSQNINSILGNPMMDLTSPGPDGSFCVRKSETRFQNQKLSPPARGATIGASDQELVYKKPENAISGDAAPEVDNVTDFTEGFRERDANNFTVPTDPKNMGLKDGKQYEMVVGRHPLE